MKLSFLVCAYLLHGGFKDIHTQGLTSVVVRDKARLVSQGHRQEEGIDYDEVFAPVARIEAITIFLAFASYMGFIVYQMDIKSAFLYGTIDKEVYVSQPPSFVDPKFPNKPLVKDEEAADVDVHLYRSMIGSLMYLTASRPDIMFAVCACSRFQVTLKTSHLQAGKKIFRYHFIRDAYEKKLIQVLKIHTDDNVADLLTKAFDVSSKELASPKQTAFGKDMSNSLMAGRLPKTTLPTRLLGDMSHHKDIYDNPSLIKKVFANIKRVGTGFSRLPSPSNDPLPGGEDSMKLKELMDFCTHISNKVLELESEVIDIKSTYKHRIEKLERRVDRLEEENRGRIIAEINEDVEINLEEAQAKPYRIDLEHQEKVLIMQDVNDEELADVEEVLEVAKATKLMTEVVTTAGATTTAKATKVNVLRKRIGVVIQDPEETTSTVVMQYEVQSKDKGKGIHIDEPKLLKGQAHIEQDEAFARQLKAKLNADINWNVVMEQVKRSERLNDIVMNYQALKRKRFTEAQARKNMIIYLKNMAGYKINYFKGMTYSEII
nr:ribonuclease H-like domain-containing protein [Tanacetum cinerariifolium]